MFAIGTFSREMNDVCRIDLVSTDPIGDILTKSTFDFGFISYLISFAQMMQTCLGPTPYGNHDSFLVHIKLALFIKL